MCYSGHRTYPLMAVMGTARWKMDWQINLIQFISSADAATANAAENIPNLSQTHHAIFITTPQPHDRVSSHFGKSQKLGLGLYWDSMKHGTHIPSHL